MKQSTETLFTQNKKWIDITITRNRPLLAALRLEYDDVVQDLSIAMLSAIEKFDPQRSNSIEQHILCSLQYEILNIKRRYKPHGMTGIPSGDKVDFLYMDAEQLGGGYFEIPQCDDTSSLEYAEFLEDLSDAEQHVVDLRSKGLALRKNTHKTALETVRHKYSKIYETETTRRMAA